jgi:hypothetical protein
MLARQQMKTCGRTARKRFTGAEALLQRFAQLLRLVTTRTAIANRVMLANIEFRHPTTRTVTSDGQYGYSAAEEHGTLLRANRSKERFSQNMGKKE